MDWEQIGQRIADLGKDVTERVKDTAEVVRLKQRLSDEERNLRNAYAAIGQIFYETHEGEVKEEYIPYFENVGEARAAVEDYKETIAKLKKEATCPVCGTKMDEDAQFCIKCGAKIL